MRISPPQGFRFGGNQAWDHCALCGDRLWPESMLGEYEGKKYCAVHLAGKIDQNIDYSGLEFTEERNDE